MTFPLDQVVAIAGANRQLALRFFDIARTTGARQAAIGAHALGAFFEDEQEWYDKTRKDNASRAWGIWDESDETPKLIGSTALTRLEESPLRQMTSGSVLFDSSYWGRGIASAIHKARTWYAFNQLDLVRLKSAVLLPNVGSRKALSRSGYFHHSLERNETFVDGKLQHLENLECLNPSPHAWDRWWGNDEPTAEALAARLKKTE